MLKKCLTIFVISFYTIFIDSCFSGEESSDKGSENTQFVKQQIDEMQQQQIDQLQRYVFNLQNFKDNPNAVNKFEADELVEQIKLLRKQMEQVKSDINTLKYDLKNSNSEINGKINEIRSEVEEQSDNRQILDLIDSRLELNNDLKAIQSEKQSYVDSLQFKKDRKDFKEVLNVFNKRNFDLAIIKLKEFIRSHPNNIINSEAFFYLGEIFYEKKNYTGAAVNYLKGFQTDKTGTRALSNITMLANCLTKIGNYNKACKIIHYIKFSYHDIPVSIDKILDESKIIAKCNEID